jgi:hypothetical protein
MQGEKSQTLPSIASEGLLEDETFEFIHEKNPRKIGCCQILVS